MAYTSVWNNAVPLGTASANTIDELFRSLKVDISQRLLSVFAAIDADPLVIKSGVTTAGTFGVGTNLTVGGTLGVTGAAAVGGTLGVTGVATFATNINQTTGTSALQAITGTTLGLTGTITHGTHKRRVGTTASVATAATTIFTGTNNEVSYIVVSGDDGTNGFVDVIIVSHFAATAPVTIAYGTTRGAPPARTYTQLPGNNVQLAMASGGAMSVKIAPLTFNA